MPELKNVTGENFHSDVTLDTELTAHTSRQDDPHNVGYQKGLADGFASLGADAKVPTSQLPSIASGGLSFIGTWDASAGHIPQTPPGRLWHGEINDYWIVNVAGNYNLNGITEWEVQDIAILVDGGVSGAEWAKIPATSELHNIFSDLQGGETGQYFHLNASTHNTLTVGNQNADHLHQHLISGNTIHNDTLGLDGGDDGDTIPEYYHLTEDQHTDLVGGENADLQHIHAVNQYHVVAVAKDGNDSTGDGSVTHPFLTISAALASISGNTQTTQYGIKVLPGTYVEANPLVMKDYVSVWGDCGLGDVTVIASDNEADLFQASTGLNALHNITMVGPTVSGYALSVLVASTFLISNVAFVECVNGIHQNHADSQITVENCVIQNLGVSATDMFSSESGILSCNSIQISGHSTIENIFNITGSDALSTINNFKTNSNNITTAVNVSGGADVTLIGSRITGDLGDRFGTALKCTGTGSELDALSTYIQHADYGIYADGECEIDVASVIIENCQYGIYTHTTGNETLHIHGGSVSASIDYDIYLTESTCTLVGSGMAVDEDKLYLDSASVYMAHMSTNIGDEGLGVKGELHVGSPESPSESVFGEGDSYTRGLLAYSYNGSTYTDISTSVKSFTGSTFTFANLNIDSAIYLSSDLVVNGSADYHRFYGIKMSLDTSQSGGTIIGEYWDGADWTEFKTMTSDSGGSYYRNASELFKSTPGSYQVRHSPSMREDWVKNNDPSFGGGDRYWVRYRITDTLTVAPIFEQWKVHSSRTELNGDGFLEFMGDSRPRVTISVPWSTFQDSASKMGDKDLYLTTNCHTGFKKNKFDLNGDSIGTVFTMPSWVDTSGLMSVSVVVVPSVTGTLEMKCWLNSSIDGDTVYTADPADVTGDVPFTVSQSVTANQQITYDFVFDISDKGIEGVGVSPETLWLNLETSSLPGEIYGMVFDIGFLSWRAGGHVVQ